MRDWVKKITEDYLGKAPFKIGDLIDTTNGHTVEIVSGQYWGIYGLSNFWSWKRVLPNGSLSKKTWCGYGYVNDGGLLVTEDNEELEDDEMLYDEAGNTWCG